MLDYENQLLLDAIEDSQLFIFARGLSTEKVLTSLFKAYATDAHLVFVLSASASEELYYTNKLPSPKVVSITTEFNPNQRKELYANGGVFFITSRILIVDFLKDVVPSEKISGVILLRAHNVVESSQEAFILRLYRTNNKTGFIKAFSHSPTRFLLGFSKVNSIMRSCFLANLSLWPRFHAVVKESLKAPENQDSVTEIQLKLTKEMEDIQSNLLDLITCSISELKRLVPSLNDEDFSSELALTKNFEKIIQAEIDPIWNTIGIKSKEILSDLKIFRLLLAHLTKSDCITFYSTLCNYTSRDVAFKSSWVLTASAEKIIQASKLRILPPNLSPTKTDADKSTFHPEVSPKWLALGEILKEMCMKKERIDDSEKAMSQLKTIIFAEDIKTCAVIRDFLTVGSELTIAKLARNYENIKLEIPGEILLRLDNMNKKSKLDSGKSKTGNDPMEGRNTEVQTTLTQIERKYEDIEFLQTPVFIRPLKTFGDSEAFGVAESLESLRPDVIIVFDPELELIRNIEVHRARLGASQNIQVYFLVFRNSIEEQIYLTAIQREKIAFEKLIQEKASMVVPKEREGKDELNQDLWRDPTKANEAMSSSGLSRRNMEEKPAGREVILVDMREFRSELPSLIHKRGIELEPLTLDVGDYILTPDICVERKSISDLIGSLNSGRLYKQAEAMGRHYKKPVLLIEHEHATSRNKNDLSQVMPKLQLLTMNFPNLRVIWSPGAHYTAEVFHELKRGKDEPNPEQALSILKESTGAHTTSKYNPTSHSFLSKLPGVSSQNVYTLLNKCESLDTLCSLSEAELSTMLENKTSAGLLYTGIHSNLNESESGLNEMPAKSGNKRGIAPGRSRAGPSSRVRKN